MPTTSRFPWPQRTTMTAGVLLLVSAVLLLLERSQAAVPITNVIVIPLSGPVVSFAATLTQAAGFVVAAVGVAGEVGIAGGSRVGTVALVVWGVRTLVFDLLALVPADLSTAVLPALGYLGLTLTVLFVAAAVVATVAVVRAHVLSGFARWALLPAAVVDCAFATLSFLPQPAMVAVQTALIAAPTEFLDPVLIGLIAVAFLLWSRTEAVKHRAKAVYDAW